MSNSNEDRTAPKDKELIQLLSNLIDGDLEVGRLTIEQIVRRLESIYRVDKEGNFFRHSYALITKKLFEAAKEHVAKEKKEGPSAVVEAMRYISGTLVDLFYAVIDYINKSVDRGLSSQIYKLIDHISLESERSDILSELSNKIIENQASRLKHLEASLENSESNLKDLQDKISGYQKNSITILGIFAGVVLAFNSGVQFSIAGLNASDHSSVLAVAFIVSIVGLFVFNALFTMFTFIFRIIRGRFDPFVLMSRRTFFAINTTLLGFAAILGLTFGVQQSNITIFTDGDMIKFYWHAIILIIVIVLLSIIFAISSRVWEPYRELKYWWKHRKD